MIATIIDKKLREAIFPKLARHVDLGYIVLFSNSTTGTIISSSPNTYGDDFEVGYYSNNWVVIDDIEVWEELSEVTINFKA